MQVYYLPIVDVPFPAVALHGRSGRRPIARHPVVRNHHIAILVLGVLVMQLFCQGQHLGHQHLWARGYFCASSGTVTDAMIKAYIEHQDVPVQDGFTVTDEKL